MSRRRRALVTGGAGFGGSHPRGLEPALSLREGLSRIIAALRAGRGAELEGDAA